MQLLVILLDVAERHIADHLAEDVELHMVVQFAAETLHTADLAFLEEDIVLAGPAELD